ncbi:MAG: hypothetical protein ACYS0G_08600 [Planctomycetota bacterium]|jgi:hypothetical protein
MISHALLLAQGDAASATNPLVVLTDAVKRLDVLNHPDELLAALANLHIVWASVLVVVGALCVLNGYRWHKWVIVACAFLGGLALGHVLSKQMGQSRIAMAAVGLLCAVIATPLLRFAVAIFGGLTGAFLGANVWTAFSDAPDAHLAGAGMGFIALGLAAFIMYRVVIVLFTSIGGAAMGVLGIVTLLLHVPSLETTVRESLSTNQLVIPLLVATGAVTGFVIQHSEMKKHEEDESEAPTAR